MYPPDYDIHLCPVLAYYIGAFHSSNLREFASTIVILGTLVASTSVILLLYCCLFLLFEFEDDEFSNATRLYQTSNPLERTY